MHVWMPFKTFLHQVDFKDTPTSEKLVIFNIQKIKLSKWSTNEKWNILGMLWQGKVKIYQILIFCDQ